MKIHTADDVTPYRYVIQGTLLFDLPEYDPRPINEGYYTYTPTDDDVAYEYVINRYPDVIDAVGKNKRPKNLCGQHEITSYWDVSNTDKCAYSFALKVTGFGIEYSVSEVQNFFLDVFPEFESVFKNQTNCSTNVSCGHNERIFTFTLEI